MQSQYIKRHDAFIRWSEVPILEGRGHELMIEYPSDFARLIAPTLRAA